MSCLIHDRIKVKFTWMLYWIDDQCHMHSTWTVSQSHVNSRVTRPMHCRTYKWPRPQFFERLTSGVETFFLKFFRNCKSAFGFVDHRLIVKESKSWRPSLEWFQFFENFWIMNSFSREWNYGDGRWCVYCYRTKQWVPWWRRYATRIHLLNYWKSINENF